MENRLCRRSTTQHPAFTKEVSMNRTTMRLATAFVSSILLAGCAEDGGSAADTARGPEGMPGMGGSQSAGTNAEHVSEGTLNSIDTANGTVNISHEPVESIGWPAMTMSFQLAEPGLAAQLEPGQRVEFRFRSGQGSTIVTEISPIEETD